MTDGSWSASVWDPLTGNVSKQSAEHSVTHENLISNVQWAAAEKCSVNTWQLQNRSGAKSIHKVTTRWLITHASQPLFNLKRLQKPLSCSSGFMSIIADQGVETSFYWTSDKETTPRWGRGLFNDSWLQSLNWRTSWGSGAAGVALLSIGLVCLLSEGWGSSNLCQKVNEKLTIEI